VPKTHEQGGFNPRRSLGPECTRGVRILKSVKLPPTAQKINTPQRGQFSGFFGFSNTLEIKLLLMRFLVEFMFENPMKPENCPEALRIVGSGESND
jgi:hypothetical protein